jgi:uncharacterized protein YceK
MLKNIIVMLVVALSLNGCADTAEAEDSTATTPAEEQQNKTANASDDTTWVAVVLTWNPVVRAIDKEFTSEVECWNFYEGGTGESRFGSQHLDHQDNPPTKDFNFGPDYLEYPIRTYRGKDGQGSVWLTCDLKSRYEGL